MRESNKPELLAPAGGWEALQAAVENGADAVYLGGKAFSARAGAENFDRERMGAALRYAHLRGVKVYITVNTLVDNREFGELADYLFFLFREGADALLVQDLGLIKWVRRVLPAFPLHASTQLTVHNAAGVNLMQKLGLTRVVLARETSRDDLSLIQANSKLELEIFVHGALCFCYSGQCLFSSMVGGRSGNRGRCAQPCRLPYRLVDSAGNNLSDGCGGDHLLSPKDLLLLAELPQLIELGVSSLKIEGRMKRPEYVATVVRIYREALDRAYNDPEHYQVNEEEIRELAQIFNRDFTTGYFHRRPGGSLIGYSRPNNRGLAIGRVQRVTLSRSIVLKSRLSLGRDDGLEVWTSRGGHEGLTVNRLKVNGQEVERAEAGSLVELPVNFSARPGDRIFKTHDAKLIERARESYRSGSRRKLPLSVKVVGRRGEPLRLTGSTGGDSLEVAGEIPGKKALRHPLTAEAVEEKISRLGNTPFRLVKMDCDLDQEVIYPISELNKLRRLLGNALEERIVAGWARELTGDAQDKANRFWAWLERETAESAGRPTAADRPLRNTRLAVAVADLPSLSAALDSGAALVYGGGLSWQGREPWNVRNVERGVDLCRQRGSKMVFILPRIWQEQQRRQVDRIIDQALKLKADGLLAGDPGGLKLALESGLPVVSDFSLPIFNDAALALLRKLGVERLTLSPELNRQQLRALRLRRQLSVEILVHGRLPLMISEHCVMGAAGGQDDGRCRGLCRRGDSFLQDRRGYLFPLHSDENCRMTLYNARTLCLAEYLDEIATVAGDGAIRLELRSASSGKVRRITAVYHRALTMVNRNKWNCTAGKKYWNELQAITPEGMTRGHYLRGVLDEKRGEGEQ